MPPSLPTPPRPSSRNACDGPPLSDAARLYLARSRSYTSQQRDVPDAKRSRPAAAAAAAIPSSTSRLQRPPPSRSASSSRRTASVNDWIVDSGVADLPLTPAQQSCPYPVGDSGRLGSRAARTAAWSAAPPEPSFGAHGGERYATPESSPEGADELARSAPLPPVAGPLRVETLPGRSAFVKRDDLTAKALARAASLSSSSSSSVAAAASTGFERPCREAATASGQRQQQPAGEKDRFVTSLVGASVLAIESIWGPSSPASSASPAPSSLSAASNPGVLPLQWFVKEVLRRSRTSCSTLQLALYYLHKSRREIRDAVARADASRTEIVRLEQELKAVRARAASPSLASSSSYPSPPRSPSDELDAAHAVHASALASELGERFSELVEAQNSPVLCGRRMFLAALISASKYLQDRNYSNRAWAKISGLAVGEINKNERAFLKVIQFQLHLRAEDFQRWTERLATLSPSPSPQPSPVDAAAAESLRQGLSRSASEYAVVADSAASQLVAGVRAHGPLTAAGRSALSRGQSAAAVLGQVPSHHHAHSHSSHASATASTSASDVRARGFPIAQPMAYRQPAPAAGPGYGAGDLSDAEGVAAPSSVHSASSSISSSLGSAPGEPRKVRALPTRRGALPRARAGGAPAASLVPASWASGSAASSPMDVDAVHHGGVAAARRVDAVSAH
ncbi:hypothetical protein JCM3775_001256 [Rhodotorula graminis]